MMSAFFATERSWALPYVRVAKSFGTVLAAMLLTGISAQASEVYHYYFGNTHSHTSYSDGGKSTPAEHFSQAKAAGFDFYAVTDHALAKYRGFTRESYEETKRQADSFTDAKFVGIAGFEYSENDGSGGKGHLTVLNSAGYLDATGPNVNLPVFYDWLADNQSTTVAASYNHAGATQYNSFGYLTGARRDPIAMYEMINSGNLHYDGFLAALNKGWRVAPIAGQDGHGTWRITKHAYRTGVLATTLTRENIMQAMRARRVYCTWDKNLRVAFSANGSIMGSAMAKPAILNFRVSVYDPDISDPNDRITRIEIVGENGRLVSSKDFSAHTVTWSATFGPQDKYYFTKVYAADKTDGPTAYSAPIWIDSPTAKGPSAAAAAREKMKRSVRTTTNQGIRVIGSKLVRDGKPFLPLGFTLVGLLSPTQTGVAGTAGRHYGQSELDAAKAWGANTLRFQISQRGFDPTDSLHSSAYLKRVKDGVALARHNGFAVILSMQDQSFSGGDATEMPEPQTLRSWDEVTKQFNGDLEIIYELFNEPKVKDTPAEWVLWRDGGTYKGQTVIGHQQLVDRVRASGSTNVLIAEGTRVGKSFIGFPGLQDPLQQLAFGIHPYLTQPIKTTASWDRYFGDFSKTHPVIATEWSAVPQSPSCQPEWPVLSPQLLDYLKSHNIGLMPWAFDILDTLVKDWKWTPTKFDGFACGTRGPGPGELVKRSFSSDPAPVGGKLEDQD